MNLVKILKEGRYDSITRDAVKRIFDHIKKSKIAYDKGRNIGKKESDGFYEDILHSYDEPLDFYLSLRYKREKVRGGDFKLNAYAYSSDPDYAIVEVEIVINPDSEPKVYSTLNSHIQDAVRHEIEHLTQAGLNKKQGKAKPTRSGTRDKISIENKNAYKYFLLRDEIPAMVHGLYKKAKHDKQPLDVTMEDYLNIFIKNGSITRSEKDKTMKAWIAFAKKNLTSSKFSKKY